MQPYVTILLSLFSNKISVLPTLSTSNAMPSFDFLIPKLHPMNNQYKIGSSTFK